MISLGGQDRADPQGAAAAGGTAGRGGCRRAGSWSFSVLGGKDCCGHHRPDGQEVAAARQFLLAATSGQQTAVTEAHEAGRYDMEQKAAQELLGRQLQDWRDAPGPA